MLGFLLPAYLESAPVCFWMLNVAQVAFLCWPTSLMIGWLPALEVGCLCLSAESMLNSKPILAGKGSTWEMLSSPQLFIEAPPSVLPSLLGCLPLLPAQRCSASALSFLFLPKLL